MPQKDPKTQARRRELQENQSPDMKLRRGIIAVSVVGMVAMGAVSLLQTGVVKHLPDPPLKSFDSDKVNSSDTAYSLGIPDGTLSLVSLAANVPLAAFGDANRSESAPLIPLAIAAKTTAEAVVASLYFFSMPLNEKKWCGYCIVGALSNVSIAALSLIEANRALQSLRVQK
ncbi:MAG: vitamin K epoxide reductase family protein [Pyrinomonadaceae bacterium]|nr:vitamin K epoxide reductase family protein [Pyrinomonadaceae bacterium]